MGDFADKVENENEEDLGNWKLAFGRRRFNLRL